MANTFTKLVAMGTAVASIAAVTFEFTPYSSQNSLIKQGVDSLKAMVQGKDAALKQLQAEYDEVIANLNNANESLETARQKLQAIYQKITGQAWDEANGDILNFDFNSLIKDGNQFENNVDGDAIASILGLPAGSSTEQIIVAIQNLQEQIADLAEQVQNLQAQVQSLQAEIATYKEEESALVLDLQQQIDDLKARAESEANAIIQEANNEEQEQLDYINNTINELENPQAAVPDEDEGEVEAQQLSFVEGNVSAAWSNNDKFSNKETYITAFNNLGLEAVTENPEVAVDFVSISGQDHTVKITDEVAYNKLMEQAEDGKLYWNASTQSFVDSSNAGNTGIYTVILTH